MIIFLLIILSCENIMSITITINNCSQCNEYDYRTSRCGCMPSLNKNRKYRWTDAGENIPSWCPKRMRYNTCINLF